MSNEKEKESAQPHHSSVKLPGSEEEAVAEDAETTHGMEAQGGEADPADPADNGQPKEAPTPSDAEPADPEQVVQGLKEEAMANYDKFLRVSAEFDNTRRRMQKEHAESMRFAITPLVRDLAGTVDTLELAVNHAKKGQEDGGAALLEGIEMVVKQIREVFTRFGVTRIETTDRPFDPTLHEALTMVESADVPENQVMEEFQAGYQLHGRVVRPARVAVSKRPGPSADSKSGPEQ